jgi:hypothetical protein
LRTQRLAFSFLLVLGCAKGQEIDPQEVVILTVRPPSTADASVDSGTETPAATLEVSPAAPRVTPTPDVVEASDTSPEVEVIDAATPALGDSGT